ncbi:hypothetical protein BGZ83_011036 [Gryganskiella cystojenkinii]|nr:hypothetical protein BGZ83_011036 [Gryganskiella cystojenkinii]
MATEIRLQRQLEHNKRLREQYERERISVSQAGNLLIQYCMEHKDVFVTQVWGELDKSEDPFLIEPKGGCGCNLM